ncbi:OLC1v1039023C1 [Oldenlandia corymbosa var. corymbosa]|uniref:OLC1v1039023C1 n=1 Tax=Oldenlandia corymbosa var. corymbosa TaxID=529605 RepID=A0AAV1D4U8_OLDCO|nr:OLC1v1039023C1 [Oldenlandia corymbosa var. corymbosa]
MSDGAGVAQFQQAVAEIGREAVRPVHSSGVEENSLEGKRPTENTTLPPPFQGQKAKIRSWQPANWSVDLSSSGPLISPAYGHRFRSTSASTAPISMPSPPAFGDAALVLGTEMMEMEELSDEIVAPTEVINLLASSGATTSIGCYCYCVSVGLGKCSVGKQGIPFSPSVDS